MLNKTKLLAAKVHMELLSQDFPRRLICGEDYVIAPRTFWESLGITPRQVDRIYSLLKKLGVIKTVVKQYNGKPTLHVCILTQNTDIVESLVKKYSAGKRSTGQKNGENHEPHSFHHKNVHTKSGENRKSHGFHQHSNSKNRGKPANSRFSPKSNNISYNNYIIRESINEREISTHEKPEITKIRNKLLEAGLPEGAVNYTIRKAKQNKWLLENLECLIYSRYFENVRSKLGIVLALVQNPGKYNYLRLKTAGESEQETGNKPDKEEKTKPVIELTHEQVGYLTVIRGILEKDLTKEKVIDFVLKKAVINRQNIGRLLEFTKTDYFIKKVRNKSAFMIAFLDDPDRFEMPVVKESIRKLSVGRGRGKKPIFEERSVETYTELEKLFKDALRNNREDMDQTELCNSLGIPCNMETSSSGSVEDDEKIDDVLDFLGIPKPKTA